MRNRITTISIALLSILFLVLAVGCTTAARPSDAEVLKAIDDSGLLKGGSFTVTSPLTIVERGERKDDGSWPVKVKMTLTIKMEKGKIVGPKENTAMFRIYKGKNTSGGSVWMAALGS